MTKVDLYMQYELFNNVHHIRMYSFVRSITYLSTTYLLLCVQIYEFMQYSWHTLNTQIKV